MQRKAGSQVITGNRSDLLRLGGLMTVISPRGFFPCILLGLLLVAATAAAETLEIPGSGNPGYALERLADAFNAAQKEHVASIPYSTGTAGGIRAIEEKTASLARVGRPLKEEERARGLVYVPLGRDPVIFAGGADVTARSITSAQILDVYSGRITDWRELGGKSGHIRAIGRELTDASRQAISRYLPEFQDLVFPDSVKMVHLDPQLIELMDRYPTSLGFLNGSALKACATKIVPLALNGIEPTMANMENGSYPIWLEFGLIYKTGSLSPGGKAFIDFVISPAGATILRNLGVLPAVQAP